MPILSFRVEPHIFLQGYVPMLSSRTNLPVPIEMPTGHMFALVLAVVISTFGHPD
jgi:hypothetical protein